MEENYNLSYLKALEAESIHIIREVAAEFRNPSGHIAGSDKERRIGVEQIFSGFSDAGEVAHVIETDIIPGFPPVAPALLKQPAAHDIGEKSDRTDERRRVFYRGS